MQSKWASHHSYYLFLFWITIICVAIFYLPPDDGVPCVWRSHSYSFWTNFSLSCLVEILVLFGFVINYSIYFVQKYSLSTFFC